MPGCQGCTSTNQTIQLQMMVQSKTIANCTPPTVAESVRDVERVPLVVVITMVVDTGMLTSVPLAVHICCHEDRGVTGTQGHMDG